MSLLINIGYFTIKCLMDKRKCHVIHVLRRITLKYRKTNLFYENFVYNEIDMCLHLKILIPCRSESPLSVVGCKLLHAKFCKNHRLGMKIQDFGWRMTALLPFYSEKNDSAGKTEIKFLVLPEFW